MAYNITICNTSNMERWRKRFADRYNELKLSRKITQTKLAKLVGKTQPAIANYLTGKRTPESLNEFRQLALALNLPEDTLLKLYLVDTLDDPAIQLSSLSNKKMSKDMYYIFNTVIKASPDFVKKVANYVNYLAFTESSNTPVNQQDIQIIKNKK